MMSLEKSTELIPVCSVALGIATHLLFAILFPTDSMGGDVHHDTSISALIRLAQGDLLGAVESLGRPDSTVFGGPLNGFYELKPITHKTNEDLAKKADLQMKGYDNSFNGTLTRSNSSLFIGGGGNRAGIIPANGKWYMVNFYAADDNNPTFGFDTRGLIYYSLKSIKLPEFPDYAPVPEVKRVPVQYRERIYVPLPTSTQLSWNVVLGANVAGAAGILGLLAAYSAYQRSGGFLYG